MNTPIKNILLIVFCAGLVANARANGSGDYLTAEAKARFAAMRVKTAPSSAWREARDRAVSNVINPGDYQCGPTQFEEWIGGKFAAIQDLGAFLDIVVNLGVLDWPTYYSAVFDNNAADDYIGVNGGQTQELKKRHKDQQRFWDVPTQDVLLQGMHGADLADDAKMISVVQLLFGVPLPVAAAIVDYVQSVIEGDPGLGYGNPLFTLNAFAFSSRNEPPDSPAFGIPNKIVMGDGIIEFLEAVGLGANAPDYVHAHEFAHHVHFKLGVFDAPVPEAELPEFTRATELMADAFGAYFCAHSRGSAFQAKKVVEVFRGAFLLGDCAFDFAGHHGTPNQRAAAATWGTAQIGKPEGKILGSRRLLELFNAQLPALVAPDAN